MISQIDKKKIPLHIRTREYSGGGAGGAGGIVISGGGGEAGFDISERVLMVEISGRIVSGKYTWCLSPSQQNLNALASGTDYNFINAVYDNFDATTGTQKHLKIEVVGVMPNIFPTVPQQIRFDLHKYENGVVSDTKWFWLWLEPAGFGLDFSFVSTVRNEGLFFDISTLEALMNFNFGVCFEVYKQTEETAIIKNDLLIDQKLIIKCFRDYDVIKPIRPFPQYIRMIYDAGRKGLCRFYLEMDNIIDAAYDLRFYVDSYLDAEIIGYDKYKRVKFPTLRLAVSLERGKFNEDFLQVLSNPQYIEAETKVIITRQLEPLSGYANSWYGLDFTYFELEELGNMDMVIDLYVRTESQWVNFGARFSNDAISIINNSAVKSYHGGIISWLPPVLLRAPGITGNGHVYLSSEFNPANEYPSITHIRIHAEIHGVAERCSGRVEVTFAPHFQIMAWSVARINYYSVE